MAKKIFYVSVSLLILVLIFLAAYNFAFRNNVNDPVADPEKKEALEQALENSNVPKGKIENPLNEEVMGTVAHSDGNLYYYSFDDQSLKKATLEGKNKSVLLSNLPGIPLRVVWSPKKDQVLLYLKPSSGVNLWYTADVLKKTLVPLKAEISRLSWDNLGDKIFYQYTDPNNGARTLNISNSDGSDWKKLTDLGNKDFFIASIPRSTSVSFWSRPDAFETTSIEIMSSSGENKRVLSAGKFGADFLWSPTGEYVLMSSSDEKGSGTPMLNLVKNTTGEIRSLFVPTLISKVVWANDGKHIYYALPGSLPEGAVLPNDYFGKQIYTKDTFWKMDTETGKKTRVIDLKETNQNLDSIDLFLSPKEDLLYFTDRATKRLYRIEL